MTQPKGSSADHSTWMSRRGDRLKMAAMSALVLVLAVIVLGIAALILRRDPSGSDGAASLTGAMVGK